MAGVVNEKSDVCLFLEVARIRKDLQVPLPPLCEILKVAEANIE